MKKEKMLNAIGNIDDDLILDAAKEKKIVNFNGWKKWVACAAALALIVTTSFTAGRYFSGNRTQTPVVAATIALDVNPSMEIAVDSEERVINVTALNEDAQTLIGDMDLQNVQLDVALNAIVGSMLKHGYLSVNNNSILVSVASDDKELSAKLQTDISQKVNDILATSNIEASILSQTYEKVQTPDKTNEQPKQEFTVSKAKQTLIEKIIEAGLTDVHGIAYSYDELTKMNINELKTILEAKKLELQGIQSTGQASTSAYITKEQALANAYTHAALDSTSVLRSEVELDYEYGKMVYEIDIDTKTIEYEFEIDAITGEVINFTREAMDKDDINDQKDDIYDDIYDDDIYDDLDDRFDDDDDDDWDDRFDDDDDDWDDRFDDDDDDWDDRFDD